VRFADQADKGDIRVFDLVFGVSPTHRIPRRLECLPGNAKMLASAWSSLVLQSSFPLH